MGISRHFKSAFDKPRNRFHRKPSATATAPDKSTLLSPDCTICTSLCRAAFVVDIRRFELRHLYSHRCECATTNTKLAPTQAQVRPFVSY